MSKIDFVKLNSANVAADNSVDETKMYDINANVNIQGETVVSIDSGMVKKDGMDVASFSKWGENSLNINFMTTEPMEMCNIINAVSAFCGDVADELKKQPINI